MLSGVSVICFAGSYAVALALELSRLLFRSGVRGSLMLGFAAAGLIAHTAFLYHKAIKTSGTPLSSERDWCFVAAWVLIVAYLYLVYYHPRTPFGLFLLPLALGLIAVGWFVAGDVPFSRAPASRAWGIVHGVSLALTAVAVLIGFAAGLMYIGQSWRLKHKHRPGSGLQLPSLEWLERVNSRAMVVALLMLMIGVGSGMLLNLINRDPAAGRMPWSDPVVLGSFVLLGWLMVAVVTGKLYKPARTGRRVVYLTIASFVFLVVALAMMLLMDTSHGGRRAERQQSFIEQSR